MRVRNTLALSVGVIVAAAGLSAAGQGSTSAAGAATKKPAPASDKRDVYLSVGSQVNQVAPDGTTALHEAVRSGNAAKVLALIKAGANVKAATKYGVTPIALAAQGGDAKITDALLAAGADANTVSGEGETVLMTASRSGNPDVVKTLIAHGADVNAKEGWFQQTAMMWAAAEDHGEVVTLLAKAGADVNAKAAVIERAGRGGGGGTTTATPGGMTALLYAARDGSVSAARALVDAGADPNIGDPNGSPALVYALINGHFDVAALLLEKGANANVYDSTGRGPLYVAVDMHTLEFRFNRPDPKLTDKHTSLDLTKMLLEHGADVNHQLSGSIIAPKGFATGNRALTAGSTPFLKAATTSDVEMMKLLLDWGADPYLTNKTHSNALMLAAGLSWRVIYSRGTQEEAIEAVKLCMSLGMDINAADDLGQTALHGAAMRTEDQDANKLIQFLVDNGANLYAKNKTGRTPWDEANGELVTKENAGGDRRGINHRSLAILDQLMKAHPDPSKAVAAAQ